MLARQTWRSTCRRPTSTWGPCTSTASAPGRASSRGASGAPGQRVEAPGHSPRGMLLENLVFAASTPATTSRKTFHADENGCFTVERVPVGLTTVGFAVTYFDTIDYCTWSAVVALGQTTVVRPFEPDGPGKFTLAFAIGNGSKGALRVGNGSGRGAEG